MILSWAERTRKTIDTDLEKGYIKTLTKKKLLTKQSVRGVSLTILYLTLINLDRSDVYVMQLLSIKGLH